MATLATLPVTLSLLGPTAACRAEPARPPAAEGPLTVLVFSRTTGFRHTSIPAGVQAIRNLGRTNGFGVDATEDDSVFADDTLARYATVVFLSTTGDPVGPRTAKEAFERYIRRGGGFVGVHAAADSGPDWPWYGGLVGAYFKEHSTVQPAVVTVDERVHPATSGLPGSFRHTDEWYRFPTELREKVRVLTSVDLGARGGAATPTTWCHKYDGGLAFYTALGHTAESYHEPHVLRLLLGGILSTAGVVRADCTVPAVSSTPQAAEAVTTARFRPALAPVDRGSPA